MVPARDSIVDKLDLLPEPELREVLDFVEFLTSMNAVEEVPLLAVAGILSCESVSAQEIEQELCGDAAASNYRT